MNALLLNVVLLAASSTGPDLPSTLGHLNGRPLWVAADVAIDASGRPNAAVLGEYVARRSSESASRNARAVAREKGTRAKLSQNSEAVAVDECLAFSLFRADHFKPTSTLAELVASSEAIVAGTVVAQRQGVLYDQPGTLLQLDAQYLKGSGPAKAYMFYPYADIKTADGVLCSRPGNYDRVPPAVGDRFVAFSIGRPYNADGAPIFAPDPRRELVRETADGKLTLPVALSSSSESVTFNGISERVRLSLHSDK
ncbi:MAG TPA: hypothetical protein VEK79_09905 [Thermoanaerobaculia bacterium]|nr:hypothetical protein [Thermoanaerobaculia bacterium]